jgi:hypothetical protein
MPLRCGGEGTRTHDPLVANQVLYQLSYAPGMTLKFMTDAALPAGRARDVRSATRISVHRYDAQVRAVSLPGGPDWT